MDKIEKIELSEAEYASIISVVVLCSERQEVEMEKKVPERKVSLRDEDIFYVYDKRINRCVKEDCEGTVKYGLVLKVGVSEEETLNCFECNKCHMKYTPYPNYVRLTKTDMLTIYNQDEVTARDLKRAEDARKQALREKKNNGRKNYERVGFKKSFERKPYEKKPFEKKPYEHKPYERKPFEKKPYEGKSYDRKPFNKEKTENRSFERKPYVRKDFEQRPYEKKSYDNKSYERKSSYERKPYGGQAFEQKPKTFHGKGRNANIVITSGNYASSSRYRKPYYNSSVAENNREVQEEEYRRREY